MSKTVYRSIDELPLMLTPEDIGAVLGISRNNAYAVIHSKDFPVVKIGKQYRINKDKFMQWLETVQTVEIAG